MTILPYGRQTIDDDDVEAVVRALKSDFLTTGPEIDLFESEFAAYVGANYAVACANGTAALHLVSLALGLGPGDQVIVPAISFVATANGPRYCGADIIFADVDGRSGLITPESLSAAIQRADPGRLKAIFVVHLGGHPVDLLAISEIAQRANVPIVEDACHALGGDYCPAGSGRRKIGDNFISQFAAFSLHPVKTITSGEGGLITARSEKDDWLIRSLRGHGLVRDPAQWRDDLLGRDPADGTANPWVYEQHVLGFNYRMTDIQAALGRAQLRKLPQFSSVRRMLVARYRELLTDLAPAVVAVSSQPNSDPVQHLMTVLVDFSYIGITRKRLMEELKREGIGTQVHYIPINRQPYYVELGATPLAGADAYYQQCLSLPLFPGMTSSDVDRVVGRLHKIIGK